MDFKHITSTPRYPKSSGFVKRNIQTVKIAPQKSLRTGDDPQMTLLMLQTAPLRDRSPASATKLIGRTLRALVPKLETIDNESSSKKDDSKNICTDQILKPLRRVTIFV